MLKDLLCIVYSWR